jgi:predicted nucleic acid-binding protein
MAGELLLDTGALVSLLDRSQQLHQKCLRFFDAWEGPVVSTEAVLTEATHLLGRVRGGRQACLDFILGGGAVLVPSTGPALRRARELLEQYADLPMDYADATLVVLGEELGTDLVFTTDRRDFRLYRLRGRKPFRVVPD